MAYVQTNNGIPVLLVQPSNRAALVSSASASFIGNFAVTYKMFPDTTLSLNGIRSISPSVVGNLIELNSIGGNLNYTVNSREALSLGASGSQTTSSGTTSKYISASVTYSYTPTRDWTAQLSYRYLHRLATSGNDSGFVLDPVTGVPIPTLSGLGPASSNSILLVVSRSVTVLPPGN